MRLLVQRLDKEEVYRGWVRIAEQHRKDLRGREIPEASVVELEHEGRTLLAVVRGLVGVDDPVIKLDEISRKQLAIEGEIGREADFVLKRAGALKAFWFHWNHPEPTNRFAMRMAILSVAVGLLALIASALQQCLQHRP